MRVHRRSVMFVLMLLFSITFAVPAGAIIFNYSYTFGSGWVVSGTLEGHREGMYVVDVSNIAMTFTCSFPSCLGPSSLPDGLSIYPMAWNYETHFWDASLAPVISFDESLNNFQFINQPHYPPDFDSST